MAIFRDNTTNTVEHDRSIEDRRRHRQLVEKSIKENLGDILSEESIVGETKNKKFKPINLAYVFVSTLSIFGFE